MLELMVLDKLDSTSVFLTNDVSCGLLEEILPVEQLTCIRSEYSELIEPLIEIGRSDLANVLKRKFVRLDKKGLENPCQRV